MMQSRLSTLTLMAMGQPSLQLMEQQLVNTPWSAMSVRYEVHLDKSSGKINESCAESLASSLKCGLDRKLCWVFDTISSTLLIENTVTVYRHVRFKGFE